MNRRSCDQPQSLTMESLTIITWAANDAVNPLHARMLVRFAAGHTKWRVDDNPRRDGYKLALSPTNKFAARDSCRLRQLLA